MPHDAESSDATSAAAGPRPGQLTALLQDLARAPEHDGGPAWQVALRPGAVIGRFELVREVGRGGFGFVWEARDRELKRTVAFKAVSAPGRPEVGEERLLREAESAARLSHPNIVTLFDVGRSEHGPFLVLELLRGRTLEERLSRGRLSVQEAFRIGLEVAKGIAHAHANGVVHRDLKPANVFLCDDRQVKVLDFGMAHAFGRRRLDGGTPGYMAPEQWEGAPEDERTDVFALGVMLYRLLSGQMPFPPDGGRSLISAEPAPVLAIPGAPGLGDLVARMLQKSPLRRPRHCGEVLAALSSFQGELERMTSPGSVVVTAHEPTKSGGSGLRRSWWQLVAALLVAVGLVVIALATRERWSPPERSTTNTVTNVGASAGSIPTASIAVLPFADMSAAKDQDYFADGVAEEILVALTRVEGLRVVGRTSSFSFKGKADDLQSIGAKLGVAHVLEGSVRRDGGQIRVTVHLVKAADGYRVWSETYSRELAGIFALQDEVARAVVARLAPMLAGVREGGSAGVPATAPEAYQEVLRGRDLARRESMEGLREALAAFVRASEIDPGFAPAWAGRARVTFRLMAMEDGFEEARLGHARSAAERAIALAPQLAEGYLARAMLRRMEFDWVGAEADVARALAQGPGNAEALMEHCLVLRAVGRLPEAIAACQSAVTLDPLHPRSWYLLGDALKSAGDLAGARGALERSLQIAPDATHTPYLLTVVLVAANAPLEAMNVARAGRPWVRDFAAAVALHSLGRTAESRTILARAEGREARGDGELNATADAYQIAEAYAWIGDNDRAFALLDTAIRNHDMGVATYLRHSPLVAGLRGDARWKPLLRKAHLPED